MEMALAIIGDFGLVLRLGGEVAIIASVTL